MNKHSIFNLSRRGSKVGYIIAGILLAFGIAIFTIVVTMVNPDAWYKSGRIYGRTETKTSAVKILDIATAPFATTGDEEAYLVRHDEGFSVLVAKKNDQAIKDLVAGKTKEQILQVERESFDRNLRRLLAESYGEESFYQDIDTSYLMSREDQAVSAWMPWLTLIGFTAVALLIIGGLHFRNRANAKAIQAIEERFPEVRGNVEKLEELADYVDSEIGIMIYQGVFISTLSRIRMVELKEVDWLYHIVTTTRSYGIATNRTYALSFNSIQWKKAKRVNVVSLRKQATEEHIQVFFQVVNQQFPNILLGNDKRKDFYARKRGEQ